MPRHSSGDLPASSQVLKSDMNNIFEHYKKTGYLHHAQIIVGAYNDVLPLLTKAISNHLNFEISANPDFSVSFYKSFGIDEARVLRDLQTKVAYGGDRKIFIIGTESITIPAQNALLKTFEEPTEGTHFFIIIPRADLLLPTLLSRVLIARGEIATEDDTRVLAEKFIDTDFEGRFAISKKLAEKKGGETIDRELFRQILDNIERILYSRWAGKHDATKANIFRKIFLAKTYLSNSGSSPKMLLDNIAIMI